MADNFTQFSFAIDGLATNESAWLQGLLALSPDRSAQRRAIREALDIANVGGEQADEEYWPDFCHALVDERLWLYTEDSGNPWQAALLVRAFLAKFRPDDIIDFGVAYTCGKPRIDGFGGESFVVTSKGIYNNADVPTLIVEALRTGKRQKLALRGLGIIATRTQPKTRKQSCPRSR
jgi:hypothetical protein